MNCNPTMLQFNGLRVDQRKESCIRVTQENSIENSVQDGLPYILITHGLCSTTLAYPKWPCVSLKANIWRLTYVKYMLWHHCSRSFYYIMWVWWCDHDSIIVWQFVTVTCDVTLDPNLSFKIENKLKRKNNKWKEKKINEVHSLQFWHAVWWKPKYGLVDFPESVLNSPNAGVCSQL